MKIRLTPRYLTAAISMSLLTTTTHLNAGQSTSSGKDDGSQWVETREDFGKFFTKSLPYSDTLGLALFHWGGELYESHLALGPETLTPAGTEKKLDDQLSKLAGSANGSLTTDYSKLGLGTSLAFEGDQGGAILLRVRRKFQMLNESSAPATYDYVNDRKIDDSGSRLEAAFMLDFYLPYLYNREPFNFGPTERTYRFWIRTGFEIYKNDIPGKNEVDQQKFFGLLNFQANPDQNFPLFGDDFKITSPQIIQLGGVYEKNRISGEESWHWIAGWSPVFRLLKPHGIFTEGFGLNKRMYFGNEKGGDAKILSSKPEKGTDPETEVIKIETTSNEGFYTSIDPGFEFLGASDARGVVNKLKKIRSRKSLEKLREEQLNWHLTALVGVRDGLFELSYTVTGSHPLSDLGESHIGQEVRADLNLLKWMPENPHDWHSMTAYASYRRGQFEPTYEDIDMFTAGVSLRF